MDVSAFAPVLRALVKMGVDALFVSRRDDPALVGRRWYDADTAEALFDRLQLPFERFPNPDADIALTISVRGEMLQGYRKLRARMMYGVGVVPYYSAPVSRAFDLYLVHGSFNRRTSIQLLQFGRPALPPDRVRTMGYPRFDAWFNNPPDPQTMRKKYGAESSKPALLYLPTWEDHRSSIDAFADSILALSDRFEILAKPHHLTLRWEPERVERLKSGQLQMLSPSMPPEEAFALADVVIADVSSGAFTEAIFLNKKVVCLARKEEVESLLLPELKRQIPFCLVPEELSQKVSEALALDYRSGELQALRQEMFDTTNGADAARAAQAIVEFVEERRRPWSRVRTEIRRQMMHGATVRRVKHPVRTVRNGLRYALGGRDGGSMLNSQQPANRRSHGLPILLYHNVGPLPPEDPFGLTVAPDQFEEQVRWLVSRGYETIWPSDWLAWRREGKALPRKPVLLTFDDGYADVAEYAFPVLRSHDLKAAVYVVTRRLGLTNTWDEADGHRTMRLMTVDQVRQWSELGIEFGSHTRTHPRLTSLSEERLAEEIEGSRDDLRCLLRRRVYQRQEVESFAYPYGDGADSSVVREHLGRTYQLALTVCGGLNLFKTNPYELRRVMILPGDSLMHFERKVRLGATQAPPLRERLPWPIRTAGRLGRRALRTWRA
ncbi:MAG: polysaccharide deacetylase family protein [Candidatus Binataceae bacterium]